VGFPWKKKYIQAAPIDQRKTHHEIWGETGGTQGILGVDLQTKLALKTKPRAVPRRGLDEKKYANDETCNLEWR